MALIAYKLYPHWRLSFLDNMVNKKKTHKQSKSKKYKQKNESSPAAIKRCFCCQLFFPDEANKQSTTLLISVYPLDFMTSSPRKIFIRVGRNKMTFKELFFFKYPPKINLTVVIFVCFLFFIFLCSFVCIVRSNIKC